MKYKVLHIFSSSSFGGAEKSMIFLAANLQKSGKCENYLGVPEGTRLYEHSKSQNLNVINFKSGGSFDPAGITRLIKIIKRNKIDIVHVHQGKLYWLALTAKIFCPCVKVILHRRQDTRHSFFSRKHYGFANAVITVSKAVANGLIKYEKVAPEKITVVYNGVNFEKFDLNTDFSDVLEKYNLKDKKVAGAVGAVVDLKGKGQIFLLEAAKQLRNDYPSLRYLIVGDGEGLDALKEYAKKTGVGDITVFTGYQEQVQKFVMAMDIFCLLSWDTEGMPNVLIEAEALKKPVIATNIGGIPEAFVDGKTGIMVEPSNVGQTAAALRELMDNPQMRAQMGEEGKKFVEQNFTIEKMVSNTLGVYDKVMAEK